MPNQVNPELAGIYQRALICKTFPAYRLDELKRTPARDLVMAMELLETVRKLAS